MRVTFVTGKGGVGKSAVTAALATVLAESRQKVAIIELGETRMADFFGTTPPDHEGITTNRRLTLLNLEARACFEEYAAMQLPRRILFLIKNRWIEHFIDATPGLNEILLLGKIWALSQEKKWDHILVDAPATGHTLSLCDAPRVAFDALQHGPLKTVVGKIRSMLDDSKITAFLLVTQLENFIVQETVELHEHLTQKLKMQTAGIVINSRDNDNPLPDQNVPREKSPEAGILLDILQETREKRRREEHLFQELSTRLHDRFGEIPRMGNTTEETELRQTMALRFKPWVLKHYLKKNG